MTNLDELERLLREATPGPWGVFNPHDSYVFVETGKTHEWVACISDPRHDMRREIEVACANAALIAALRNAAPELIRDALRLQLLRSAVVLTLKGIDYGCGFESSSKEFWQGVELMRAAIAQERKG